MDSNLVKRTANDYCKYCRSRNLTLMHFLNVPTFLWNRKGERDRKKTNTEKLLAENSLLV